MLRNNFVLRKKMSHLIAATSDFCLIFNFNKRYQYLTAKKLSLTTSICVLIETQTKLTAD